MISNRELAIAEADHELMTEKINYYPNGADDQDAEIVSEMVNLPIEWFESEGQPDVFLIA
jgi:hypothetical protein